MCAFVSSNDKTHKNVRIVILSNIMLLLAFILNAANVCHRHVINVINKRINIHVLYQFEGFIWRTAISHLPIKSVNNIS